MYVCVCGPLQREIDKYADVEKCNTVLERKYHADVQSLLYVWHVILIFCSWFILILLSKSFPPLTADNHRSALLVIRCISEFLIFCNFIYSQSLPQDMTSHTFICTFPYCTCCCGIVNLFLYFGPVLSLYLSHFYISPCRTCRHLWQKLQHCYYALFNIALEFVNF